MTASNDQQSLQTISPILSSEGMDTQGINQKAYLMSEQKQLSPDWVAGLEGETVNSEDMTISEHQPSHSGGVFERDMRPM